MEATRPNGWALAREHLGFNNRPQELWNHVQEAFDLSQANESTQDEASTSNQANTSTAGRPLPDSERKEDSISTVKHSPEIPVALIGQDDGVDWGTPQEVEELNTSIKECLELERLDSKEFFNKEAKDFDSIVEYYIDLHERLYPHDLDIFVSFWYKLGSGHPLVQAMKSSMDSEEYKGHGYDKGLLEEDEAKEEGEEEVKSQAHLTREPTIVGQEAAEEVGRVMVPGATTFGYECRALSWVVRTGPPLQPQVPPAVKRLPVIQSRGPNMNITSQQSPLSGAGPLCPEIHYTPPIDQPQGVWTGHPPPHLQTHPQVVNQRAMASDKGGARSPRLRGIFRCFCFDA